MHLYSFFEKVLQKTIALVTSANVQMFVYILYCLTVIKVMIVFCWDQRRKNCDATLKFCFPLFY